MKSYDHSKIEKKWQKAWDENQVYKTLPARDAIKKKIKPYYVLDMFPYPSGSGLHVGHPRGYIASDVFARMKRMQGFNVLHPMGFDSFGLPAEQYAIQTGKNPATFTEQLVKRYKTQLSILGLSYDWDRQVATHDPKYYKWTQWIFLQIYNSWYDTKKKSARPITELEKIFETKGNSAVTAWHTCPSIFTAKEWKVMNEVQQQEILMHYRLAYEGYAEVNWCAELGTVLANDEIVEKNGKMVSERGDFPVEKKSMRQWFMRITAYGDRLLSGLETIDWSHSIKEIQKNWIGKSEGAEIGFELSHNKSVTVFTTRPDTLFGVTYVVLAPEHQLVQELKSSIKNWKQVEKYIADTKRKDDMARTANEKDKTGVRLDGIFAINPVNGESVPVWIADYVLANYGTGAVMAVPAHDERDFEFAKKYDLPIKKVIARETGEKRDNEEFKDGGAGVVFDPEIQLYAVAEHEDGKFLLFAGGVNPGESVYDGIVREVAEESGLYDFKQIEWIEASYAHYFNTAKKVNRVARAECLLFILNSRDTNETHLESHEKFWLSWKPAAEIRNWWVEHDDSDGFKHYIRFLDEAVARAIELGYDTTSDPNIFKSTPVTEYGTLEDSGKFTGMSSEFAKKKITEQVNGKWVTKYKFRDAIFARQRYWGEPIPLVHESLEKKYPKAFEIPFYSRFPFDLIKSKQKTIETRSLDKPGRDKVKVGDIVKIKYLPTKEIIFARITGSWKFKTIREIWNKNPELVKEIRPEANIQSYEELYEFYKNVDPGYEQRCDTYGLVAWRLEVLEGSSIKTVPEKQLPLELPKVKSYAPSGTGESPLSTVKSWVAAGYETNTMPGWAGSSWYFLRYTDPNNTKKFADTSELDYWFGKNGGVNMYVGGAEHATGHLLYSRFWHKVLHDLGYVKSDEPFKKLRNQGMIGGADGRKMSKRWGNVVNPDDVVKQFGADTMRVYEAFVGPFESDLPWSTDGIVGSRRFIERIWRFQEKVSDTANTPIELQKSLHKTIKKVSDDIATFSFNTAVSAMMIFANELEKHEFINVRDFKKFIQVLAPFAPYITDELWNMLGEKKTIHCAPWPVYDPKLIVDDTFTIGVQINGKVRAEITISKDINQSQLEEKVYAMNDVIKWIDGKQIKKFIYVPGRIINIVV